MKAAGKTIRSKRTPKNLDLDQLLKKPIRLRLKRTREMESPSQTTRQMRVTGGEWG